MRRKFFDVYASDGSPFAGAVVKSDICGHGPDLGASIHAERSGPIMAGLFAALDWELPRLSGEY